MRDRLNTNSMLRRHHFYSGPDIQCVLCQSGADETILHLFFACPFSKSRWQQLVIQIFNGQIHMT